jgi:hypothetical protein
MSFPDFGSNLSSKVPDDPCSAGLSGIALATLTRAIPGWFVEAKRVLLYTLREIFDEAAYSRFLARNGMRSCRNAYAAFLREQDGVKARRPKCC